MIINGIIKRGAIVIFLSVIHYVSLSQTGTGSPVWLLSPINNAGSLVVHWKTTPPEVIELPNLSPSTRGSSMTAVNKCGEPVFHVKHSGLRNTPNNLFIYDLNGNPLLNNEMDNGPGLNSKCYSGEIQLVDVPGASYEWYIIYQEWKSDNGAPLNDGDYVAARALYSRISYRCDSIIVLERDIPLTVAGTAYTYTNGRAISKLPGSPGQLCLYLVRRNSTDPFLSVDRFLISQGGIEFVKNTGDIPADNWNLSITASPIEVSSDGLRIVVNNRDQSTDGDTFFILDATTFNNIPGNFQNISLGDLILQPDNIIIFSAASVDNIGMNNPSLYFLTNMESKISEIELSPNGEYLYFAAGGFAGGGLTNTTYLGQIELGPVNNPAPYPYNLRLQIQKPPGNFDPYEGSGGLESQYPDTYYPISGIEKSYSDAMYFFKRNSPFLYSFPYPDLSMPQCLTPGDIDLSDASHPNISIQGKLWLLPDQIDGYDYETSSNPAINLGNDTSICTGTSVTLNPGGQFESYCWQDGSSEPIYIANESGTYSVEVIDEFGCFAYDTLNLTVTDQFDVNLGVDITLCPEDSIRLSPGDGYAQYLWQDGSTDSVYLAKISGTYWVEVTFEGYCKGRDSIFITFEDIPEIDLGQDTTLNHGDSIDLDAGPGWNSYYWQDGSTGQYFEVSDEGMYWVRAGKNFCFKVDTIYIAFDDCEANLVIPNCFTPNGDGFNDRFNVESVNLINFTMLIYNRWGQKIFETNDVNFVWDGKVNGQLCPIGTYFYLIEYMSECFGGIGKSGQKTGSVTLLE